MDGHMSHQALSNICHFPSEKRKRQRRSDKIPTTAILVKMSNACGVWTLRGDLEEDPLDRLAPIVGV
jgi:hypothetical protein